MANRTDPTVKSIRGTNPQNLVKKIVRSKMFHKRGLWAIKAKNDGAFPHHDPKSKAPASAEKPSKFYPADDLKKPLVNKRKSKPTKLRASITSPIRAFFPLRSLFTSSRLPVSFKSIRKRCSCSASSSDTLVAGSRKEDGKFSEVAIKKEDDEFGDLKYWMHKNGLPPCKVVLKERSSHDQMHCSIHYIAASEALKVGDVAFSMPNSLVVTLERVLGNETIAYLSPERINTDLN